MRIRSMTLLSAATLALAACGPKATTESNTTATEATTANDMAATTPAATVSPGQSFANTAAASDAFEIETSKAALATSSSPAIKKYAQAMIDAHTASTAKLKAAAGTIVPDPTLNAEQQQKLDALKAKTGADFNQAYVTEQTAGHQQTLDALKGYAATGDVPALKTFATGLVPTVTAHLNMAKTLKP